MLPRREFTAQELDKSFKELDLVPSAVLMILPVIFFPAFFYFSTLQILLFWRMLTIFDASVEKTSEKLYFIIHRRDLLLFYPPTSCCCGGRAKGLLRFAIRLNDFTINSFIWELYNKTSALPCPGCAYVVTAFLIPKVYGLTILNVEDFTFNL